MVSPELIATVLSIWRCWIVGASIPEESVSTALLTSCLISMVTRPLLFTRGVTSSMTPVVLYWISFTVGAAGSILLTDCRDGMGISSPILILAVWLSSTIREGEDRTLRS